MRERKKNKHISCMMAKSEAGMVETLGTRERERQTDLKDERGKERKRDRQKKRMIDREKERIGEGIESTSCKVKRPQIK